MRIALAVVPWTKMKSSYPPLGLGYLAAAAEAAGHQAAIFDFGLTPETTMEQAVGRLADFEPDILGVSVTTNGFTKALALARSFKERCGKPVVFGGPHPSMFPFDCLSEGADYALTGEAEHSLPALLRWIERRDTALEEVPGLFWKEGTELKQGAPTRRIDDLDTLALPARHLFQIQEYPLKSEDGRLMTNMMTSRGCPFNCSYCYKGIFGDRCRTAGADTVLAEIRQIMEFGIDRIYFIDDLFTFSRRRVREICRRLIDERLNIKWQCLSRVDMVDAETLGLMAEAGCEVVNYGIESGDRAVLEATDKRIELERVRRTVTATKAAGIKTKGYFMIGLPGDNEETMRRTIDLACSLQLDDAMFSLTTPFPGTRLWEASGMTWESEADRFAEAFYYVEDAGKAGVFCNLSNVDDATLLRYMGMARERFAEVARRRRIKARFGPGLGDVAAALAGNGTIRQWAKRFSPVPRNSGRQAGRRT